MNRRSFLASAGIVAAFSAIPCIRRLNPPAPLSINNAYSLWYNRPAVAEIEGGFCFGYLTSDGEVAVAEVTNDLLVRRTKVVHKLESPSDHGSPSLAVIPSGKYKGHIIACFSKHATQLICARTRLPGDMGAWEILPLVDDGRSTYASLAVLPDGQVMLMHTIQERIGNYDSGEWRRTVVRTSDSGGDSWSDPVQVVGNGAGTFPYSTPLALSRGGRCAMSYAMYKSATKRHEGLSLVVTSDAFKEKTEIKVDLGDDEVYDTIPYETKWVADDRVAIVFSHMSAGGSRGVSKVAFVDLKSATVESITSLSETEVHSYAGGAAIDDGGRYIITSPPGGGLIEKCISSGSTKVIADQGSFSSPWIFTVGGKSRLAVLKNPVIKNSRNYSADLFFVEI